MCRSTPSASWHQYRRQRVEHVAQHPGLHQRGDPCRRRRSMPCSARNASTRCRSESFGPPSRWSQASNLANWPQPAGQLWQAGRCRRTSCSRCARSSDGPERGAGALSGSGTAPGSAWHRLGSARGRRPVGAEAAGRSQARRGAVLVEAPAVVRACEHHPVIVQRRQKLLGGNRLRGVHRVAVGHLGKHGRRVDVVAAAECHEEAARARRAASGE